MEDLTEQIAQDGEGARKVIVIRVVGATDEDAAQRVARTIGNSLLVKTAIAGSDPNWGRVLSAIGNSGVEVDLAKVDIYMQGVLVCSGGIAVDFDEASLKTRLDDHECLIRVEIKGDGKGETRFWACDLTEDYVKINASYRT
jgi:glutamate N-acetyltransferase/amino-acid N-acetyltransferase